MAKDPAFLFYSSDFLTGTMLMNHEQVGKYIRLLCIQHQKGHLTEKQIISICDGYDEDIMSKFKKDDQGLYYQERLEYEANKRKAFSESRRQSRLKCDEDNVRIYIVRDNVRLTYKIGSSVNPIRRYNELSNQKNPAIMADNQSERNLTLIWFSDPVQRKEEKVLHAKFSDKHLLGEWYSLDEVDISYIVRTYGNELYDKTYVLRTENENENINKEELLEYKKFNDWILKNAPNVSKMKEPFTNDQYQEVKKKFNKEVVKDVLMAMHNSAKLKNNISAYLTLCNWIKRREDSPLPTPVKSIQDAPRREGPPLKKIQ